MTIFERIKKLSNKQGKSLQKVSEDLGLSTNYLYRLKTQQPTAEKLTLIADYFHVSVDYLLGREDIKPVTEPIDLAELANSDDDYIFDNLTECARDYVTYFDVIMPDTINVYNFLDCYGLPYTDYHVARDTFNRVCGFELAV